MTWSSPHGRGSPARDFEEARARADEVRQRANMRHGTSPGARQRRLSAFVVAALVVAAMTYPVWHVFGPLVGMIAGAVFTLGAVGLWRLWR